MDEGFTGGSREKSVDDVGVINVGKLVASLREAPDVLTKSLSSLLSAVLEIP
jgi:hypothetical protein